MKNRRNIVLAIVLIIVLVCMAFHPWRLFMHDEDGEASASTQEIRCAVSVSCADALAHPDLFKGDKAGKLPADGWILPETEVTVSQGDSVLTALQTACREQNIPVETSGSPAYVEGIGNLYSGDGGETSGWTYTVNGTSPTVGGGEYQMQSGDQIVWNFVTAWVS